MSKTEKYYENFKMLVLEKYNLLPSDTKFFEDYGLSLKLAPWSTTQEYGGAYAGGLLEVIYEEYLPRLYSFKDMLNSNELTYDSALKVILFQHISKAFYFKPTEEDWKRKKGIMYEFDNDRVFTRLKGGEYSYLIASRYGLKLEPHEYEAFLSIDKKEADSISMHSSELTSFIFFLNNIVQRRLFYNKQK